MFDAGGRADLKVAARQQKPPVAVVEREFPHDPDQLDPEGRIGDFEDDPGQERTGADSVFKHGADAVVFRVQRGFRHGREAGFPHEIREIFERPLRKAPRFGPEILPEPNQPRPRIIVVPLQMHVDQSVDEIDFRRVELCRELPPPPPERDGGLKLMGAPPCERVVAFLQFGEHFPELLLTVQKLGHGADRHVLILIVQEGDQAFKTRIATHSASFS